MTRPREVLPGRTYMITRRCTQRMFLLQPDAVTEQCFLYCLAVAAERYGIEVNAASVMSNHHHSIIHDVRGNYPEFLQFFHGLLARSMNCARGRWESFFAPEQPGVLHLGDAAAVVDKMGYALCNPVLSHLVDRAHLWPGVCTLRHQLLGKPIRVRRPRHLFRAEGPMPEEVELRLAQPRELARLSHDDWCAVLRAEVARREAEAAEERRRNPALALVGRKTVRRQSPFASPRTMAPRRALVPRVATRNKWLRIELLGRSKLFRVQYAAALARSRAGDREVLFPAGTYALRIRALVRCHPFPATC